MLKQFKAALAKDSIRAEFGSCLQAGGRKITLSKIDGSPAYTLKVEGIRIGFLLGREHTLGDKFAFVPDFDPDQEVRVSNLSGLIYGLSEGMTCQQVVQEVCEDVFEWA